MCHTSVCTKALEKSGFNILEARDYHLGADYVELRFDSHTRLESFRVAKISVQPDHVQTHADHSECI